MPSPSLSSPSPLRGHARRRVRQSTSVDIHPYRPASLDPVVDTREFGTHTKALRSIDSRLYCSRSFDRLQYARAAAHSWVSLRTELGGISQVVFVGRRAGLVLFLFIRASFSLILASFRVIGSVVLYYQYLLWFLAC
jgi:hypothetical protein